MMILQGHRSNSTSSEDIPYISESQRENLFPRRDSTPWARESSLNSYHFNREANLTPFNTMHMPRLDSFGTQEPRSHIPIWEPLYMEDAPDQKGQVGQSNNEPSIDTNGSKQQLKNSSDGADREDSGIDHGCCSWKLCLSVLTANWMSRAM